MKDSKTSLKPGTQTKLEILLDVLAALENSNAPELYGVKITVIDKIERAVSKL